MAPSLGQLLSQYTKARWRAVRPVAPPKFVNTVPKWMAENKAYIFKIAALAFVNCAVQSSGDFHYQQTGL